MYPVELFNPMCLSSRNPSGGSTETEAQGVPTLKLSAALPHSCQRLKKESYKKLLLPRRISYCNYQQLFNTKATGSSYKVLGNYNPFSGETEGWRGRELCLDTQTASDQTPSSSIDVSCDYLPRLCCLLPGENKKQVCSLAAYKTINIVQGCDDTIIIHRSET